MRCDLCGTEEAIPFKCRYCKGAFCAFHRLPPNHECVFMKDYLEQPVRDREFLEHIHGRAGLPQERIKSALYDTIYLRFSKTEILHLLLATGLVTAVGMSFYGFRLQWDFLIIFISAFIVHELGHKFLAQFYRAWAEFRVLFFGAVITAISALPFLPFKFIAPGVVWVSGNLTHSRSGKVSWIGPLTNLAMGTGFLVSYLALAAIDSTNSILLVGVRFNGLIAFFNMIPFMGLDGQKIFGWNKLVWVLTFAAGIGLFIAGDLLTGGFTAGFLGRFF
ncbi:MAG TPA: AN1-type zinc finger domain-containing protein [Nitrososphaera sp.]|nr:AN1-type zinc finger domain-containing protein [Nitrososphaera sp.]